MSKKVKRMQIGTNRKVCIIDGRINYIYFTHGKIAYCTYNPLLFEILNLRGISPTLDNKHPDRIRFCMKTGVLGHTFLSALCWACYHGKITSIETWQKELKKVVKRQRNFRRQIDHADCNQLNCTVYNLSEMGRTTNRRKHAITAAIKEPAILYSGQYGNEYRISALWPNVKRIDGKVGVCINLKCRTAQDYVDCLADIRDIGAGYGRPLYCPDKEFWKANNNSLTKLDVAESIRGQEVLATITDCIPCKKGGVKKLYKEITGINLT